MLNERSGDAARMTVADTKQSCDVTARQLAPVEKGLQDLVGSRGQRVAAYFLFGPQQ